MIVLKQKYSSGTNLSLKTLMEKTAQLVLEKIEFDYRNLSKLEALFDSSGILEFPNRKVKH